MATTNLISKSLGDVLQQSGNGTPDHGAPIGTTYVNKDSGSFYCLNSLSAWTTHEKVSYGNMWLTGNTTNTTISDTATWYGLRALAWEGGDEEGVTYDSANYLVIRRPGKYHVSGTATLEEVATDGAYGIGLSIDFAEPIIPDYMVSSVEASDMNHACIVINSFVDFTEGQTVEIGIRNFEGTQNVTVVHSSIIARRIKD